MKSQIFTRRHGEHKENLLKMKGFSRCDFVALCEIKGFYEIVNISICAMLMAVLVSGCAVGPNYSKPEVKVPATFHEAKDTGTPDELVRWWTVFNDPMLNSLVEKAVKSNHDLRLAEARIKEVRALFGATDSDRWPKLNASGSYSKNRGSENTFQNKKPALAGLSMISSRPGSMLRGR